jgi:hypothetical protein
VLIGEELELLKHGYLKCYYVSGYCPTCGAFRVVAALAPAGEWCACPQCGRAHCNCAVMGWGLTRRVLPEYAILWSALRLSDLPKDDPTSPPRVDAELLASAGIPEIAQTLGVGRDSAIKIRRRAFPGRRLHTRLKPQIFAPG